jgi:hypothetical protein
LLGKSEWFRASGEAGGGENEKEDVDVAGAILLVAALGPTILGVWLSFKLTTAKEVANQRESRAEIFRSAHAYPAGDIESEAQSLPGTEIKAKKR